MRHAVGWAFGVSAYASAYAFASASVASSLTKVPSAWDGSVICMVSWLGPESAAAYDMGLFAAMIRVANKDSRLGLMRCFLIRRDNAIRSAMDTCHENNLSSRGLLHP